MKFWKKTFTRLRKNLPYKYEGAFVGNLPVQAYRRFTTTDFAK